MRSICLLCVCTLFGVMCAGQESKTLEQDLSSYYVGRSFENRQPYLNREVWYDRNGSITENPIPVCPSIYGRLEVKRISVRGDQIMVQATRSGLRPPMRNGQPVWPSYASRDIVLRYKSDGQPWSGDAFDKAFQNSMSARSSFVGLPPGTTAPAEGSDRRIAYIFEGSPVYRPGNGVTPPRQMDNQNPEYTESARRAKAGGHVLLRFIVNEDGSVSNVISALPPLGFQLDEQSVRTAQQWRFTPATLDGQPVKVDVHAETSFCLY